MDILHSTAMKFSYIKVNYNMSESLGNTVRISPVTLCFIPWALISSFKLVLETLCDSLTLNRNHHLKQSLLAAWINFFSVGNDLFIIFKS